MRENHRGFYLDIQRLREMGASEVVWLAVNQSKKKRRQLESALDLIPGQIDRWTSRKDHHTPALEVLPELIEHTSEVVKEEGAEYLDVAGNVIVQWLFARARNRNLQYDPKSLSIEEMERQLLHLGSEFGQISTCVIEAGTDNQISRAEAMRIKLATAEIIGRCQTIMNGVEPYI